MIGVFSDSHGDLAAFDAAYSLLKSHGAKRFFFLGGRYTDLDEWILKKKEDSRGGRAYSDNDFLADVSNFLSDQAPVARPPAWGEAVEEQSLDRVKERFVRTPEKGSLQYLDPTIDKKRVDMLGDALCCLVYDKNDLTKEDLMNGQIFIHGRESEPKVVQIGPRFFVTAGKLTGAADQTCGLFDTTERPILYSALTLAGRLLIDKQPLATGRTKLLVK